MWQHEDTIRLIMKWSYVFVKKISCEKGKKLEKDGLLNTFEIKLRHKDKNILKTCRQMVNDSEALWHIH